MACAGMKTSPSNFSRMAAEAGSTKPKPSRWSMRRPVSVFESFAIATPKDSNTLTGRLMLHRDGFGFVLPASAAIREKFEGDVFIPAHAIGTAMHGDHVIVELSRAQRGSRAEGRILKVANRAHATVVGIFHRGPKYNFVMPIDERIHQEIIIPPGAEIPEPKDVDAHIPAGSADTP